MLNENLIWLFGQSAFFEDKRIQLAVIAVFFGYGNQPYNISAFFGCGLCVTEVRRHNGRNTLGICNSLDVVLVKADGGNKPVVHKVLLFVVVFGKVVH